MVLFRLPEILTSLLIYAFFFDCEHNMLAIISLTYFQTYFIKVTV